MSVNLEKIAPNSERDRNGRFQGRQQPLLSYRQQVAKENGGKEFSIDDADKPREDHGLKL
jgi:hypothetical protein